MPTKNPIVVENTATIAHATENLCLANSVLSPHKITNGIDHPYVIGASENVSIKRRTKLIPETIALVGLLRNSLSLLELAKQILRRNTDQRYKVIPIGATREIVELHSHIIPLYQTKPLALGISRLTKAVLSWLRTKFTI